MCIRMYQGRWGGGVGLFVVGIEGRQGGTGHDTSFPLQGMEQPDHAQASQTVDPAHTPGELSVSKSVTSSYPSYCKRANLLEQFTQHRLINIRLSSSSEVFFSCYMESVHGRSFLLLTDRYCVNC